MAITYNWIFSSLECKPREGDLVNVVKTVHWRLAGRDGEFYADVYGATSLPDPADPEDYIEFDDLTEAEVQAWVEDQLGEEQIQTYKDNIASQIEALKNPPVVSKSPPWGTSV